MHLRRPADKICDLPAIKAERERLRREGKTVVFTNGCFDIMHAGHVDYIDFARRQGDVLVIAINSDASVRRNKGKGRPVISQGDRAKLLGALEAVDYVLIFDDDEPIRVLSELLPDILVKGEDWRHYVSGREVVEQHGGRIVLAPLTPGHSTTNIMTRILAAQPEGA